MGGKSTMENTQRELRKQMSIKTRPTNGSEALDAQPKQKAL